MKLTEVIKDLFTVDSSYKLAHCISADCAMGIHPTTGRRYGIAAQFNDLFPGMKQYCLERKPVVSDCIPYDRVYNLVTKSLYFQKPTYTTMRQALISMKLFMFKHGADKVAMPTIGSDLDNLEWSEVRKIIEDVFSDTDIEILVCRKP